MNKIKVGDIFTTNSYGDCVVVEYVNARKIKVKFITTGYETWCQGSALRKGNMKDVYFPSVCDVGYMGEGQHRCRNTKEYNAWQGILRRCYNIKYGQYHRYGGRGVTVCKKWYNFQTFADWAVLQPNYNKKGFDLDKDLRIKDSKEYSPYTCSFVPSKVNTLLITSGKTRGRYPVGVYYRKDRKKYRAYCSNGVGKSIDLGCHSTPEQAFQAYKFYKEALIKQVAEEEFDKGNIIEEVYNNLMKYEVVPFPE